MRARIIIFKYFFFTALAGTTFLTGCTKEDEQVNDSTPVAVIFNSEIRHLTRTTTDGNAWLQDDNVGIYMLTTNGTWPESILTNAENKKYRIQNTATGTLVPANGTDIYYPSSDNIDIVAYYPYATPEPSKTNNQSLPYSISVNLADQSNPAAIDLLYAKVDNISKSNAPVNLQFQHVFSKITLNITEGDGFTASDMERLTATDVTISQCPVGSVFMNIQNGKVNNDGNASFSLYKNMPTPSGASATFSVIIPPQSEQSYPITFMADGMDYHCTLTSDDSFLAGNHYVYPVTLSKTEATVGPPTILTWKTHDNGTGNTLQEQMDVVRIPAGSFIMGDPKDYPDLNEGELQYYTQHKVTLTKSFYMGKYEVTNTQYAKFLNTVGVGQDGTFTTTRYGKQKLIVEDQYRGVVWETDKWIPATNKENHPILHVTWYGADEFARWIGGSLPTEAQWEYACRAGTTTPRWFDDESLLGNYAWYKDNSGSRSQPVGQKLPNDWGLYDMYGNANEWCSDWWARYSDEAVTDPTGPITGNNGRILRGATYLALPMYCRSASRSSLSPEKSTDNTGFRVVFY